MTAPDPGVRVRLWDRRDCAALCVLLAGWGAALAGSGLRDGGLSERVAVDAARVEAVRERIDPNAASAASLRRLPLIGPAKAKAIIAFRQAAGEAPVFRCREDLTAVSGLGPAFVARAGGALALPPRNRQRAP